MAGMTHTYQTVIKDDAGRTKASESKVVTGTEEIEFDVSCPGSGNVTATFAVDVSAVQAFYIISDKAVTMLENVADLTVVLAAGIPYFWVTGRGTNPFSVDITTLKFTKADAGAAVIHGAFLVNGT